MRCSAEWISAGMGPDRNSGKLWRRLATSCVIGGAAISPWSHWIGLPLAGLGIAIGVPHWFKHSWEKLLEAIGMTISPPPRTTDPHYPPEKQTDGEKPRPRERAVLPTRARAPLGRTREALTKGKSNPEYLFDSWTFRAHPAVSAAPVLIPQNSIRFAADSATAWSGSRKPAGGVVSKEPIAPQKVENRHRTGKPGPQAQTARQSSRSSLTRDMEEVRRRLAKTGEGRLSGSTAKPSANQGGETGKAAPRQTAGADPGGFPEGLLIPAWSTVGEKDSPRKIEPVCRPDGEQSAEEPASSAPPTGFGQIAKGPEASGRPQPAASSAQKPNEGEAGDRIKGLYQESPAPGVVLCEPEVKANGVGDTGGASNPFSFELGYDLSLPPPSLLHPADSAIAPVSQDDLINGGILIEEKLAEFRVKVNVQDAYAGPVITRYEVQPAVGVRGGQVVSLMKDLARALGVASIRMVETIPGKTCMGLELPNERRQMIRLSEVLSSEVFRSHKSKLAMALGKDITGEPVVADLARAPHMLVAGTTGSGKSVGLNAMILSLLYRATPAEVRFVMIDPKMLELSIYDGIPHLLAPVVTDMKLAANALNWCVWEMDKRYRLLNSLHVRNLAGYNQKVQDSAAAGEPLADPSGQGNRAVLSPLPYIVVVVDELADLMMTAGKKIEELIARLAQKARAAGIHLIVATQRPSVDVITGLIKANIPTRIAFQVSSRVDSRTILDQMGAECLLGQGDMLYLPPGSGYPQRVHGAFVADEEVQAVAEHLKQFGEPRYLEEVLGGPAEAGDDAFCDADRFSCDSDPLYEDAVAFVISSQRASISAVQRHLRIGYNRAARIIEQMEASGLVSPMENNGNRTILASTRQE